MKRSTLLALALIGVPLLVAALEASSYLAGTRNTGRLMSSGREREYLLHVPATYDPAKPAALVISMHGAAMWPAAQMDASQWNRVADREGFLVVYPSGAVGLGPRIWRTDGDDDTTVDVRFIGDLIDTLRASYNIDPARIYANGLSNGGGMAFELSCAMADRIAAVGMVAAAYTSIWRSCEAPRLVPTIAFHGTADYVTPFDGGKSFVAPRPFPDIRGWMRNQAQRNRCGMPPIESAVAGDVWRTEYPDCADEATVVLYTIRGGGHTWPGGGDLPEWALGPVTRNIDASSEMWAFFARHTLRR
jgi:polyhydroxybutyrate depolymerase